MARIVGVDIPRNKKIIFSLCYIHGIGTTTAKKICEMAKVDKEKRVQDLSEKQIKNELHSLCQKLSKRLKDKSFLGKTLKQAILEARDLGIIINPVGTSGRVVWQSISPGKSIQDYSACTIKLESL